jgi:hypothetical protein
MHLIQLAIGLFVICVFFWLVNHYIPFQETVKRVLNVVVVIAVVLWLLNIFGLFSSISRLRGGN